jgi:hypothetical protein
MLAPVNFASIVPAMAQSPAMHRALARTRPDPDAQHSGLHTKLLSLTFVIVKNLAIG